MQRNYKLKQDIIQKEQEIAKLENDYLLLDGYDLPSNQKLNDNNNNNNKNSTNEDMLFDFIINHPIGENNTNTNNNNSNNSDIKNLTQQSKKNEQT